MPQQCQSRTGMVSVEMLMIIAIGAMILLGVTQFWQSRVEPRSEQLFAVVLGLEKEEKFKAPDFSRPWEEIGVYWGDVGNDKADSETAESALKNQFKELLDDLLGLSGDSDAEERIRERLRSLLEQSKSWASFGLDFMPVISNLKSLYEVITGKDLVTGKPVNRWAAGIGLAAGPLKIIGKGVAAPLRWIFNKKTVSRIKDRLAKIPGLGKLFKRAPIRGAGFFYNLATAATRNASSDKLVLGKFVEGTQQYTKVAAHYKASYFKLDNWRELSKTLSDAELWKINQSFLRQQVKQGKQIILSHDPSKATGFFRNEVDFLSKFYRFEKDGWVWKAILK